MTRRVLAMALGVLLTLGGAARGAEPLVTLVVKVEGLHALAIQTALAAFAQEGLDVRPYQLAVLESDAYLTVLFADPLEPGGTRGSAKVRPEYEVLMDKKTLAVVGAHFIQ